MSSARSLLAASRKSRRITSPHATYSLAGALFCSLCSNTPIKSESLWDSHVSSPLHKSNLKNISSKPSHKRPADTNPVPEQGVNTKRLKTAQSTVKNLALPVGFFDDDEDDEDEGVVSTGEVIEPESKTGTPREATPKLPADFFNATSKEANKQPKDLDDEWAAFQAEIAEAEAPASPENNININTNNTHTISAPALTAAQLQEQSSESLNSKNALSIAEEEMDDARAAMLEFFDEQASLEERVARLKQRREQLRQNNITTVSSSGIEKPKVGRSNSVRSVTMGGMDDNTPSTSGNADDEEESDEDYEDDDEMFLRGR